MRKLVTVRTVDKILSIKGADRIEICVIGGWSCITKKGEFKEGDSGLYFEIDSWIPATDTRFEFLGSPKGYKGRDGWRIRTMKLRGVVSQGLLLPLTNFPELDFNNEDHAETLKVEKWELDEAQSTGTKAGNPEGRFPKFIPKTDQERLQNIPHYFEIYKDAWFEETMKLDGSSLTAFRVQEDLPWYKKIANIFLPDTFGSSRFGVCSRNLELKAPKDKESKSDFWQTALKYKLDKKIPVGYAVQGELIGPRIQSNHEKVNDLEFHIFDIYNINEQRYLTPEEREVMMATSLVGVPHVPVTARKLQIFKICPDYETFQDRVTGESMNPGTVSEGRVYKSIDGAISFKLISNKYLLKEK